jgi:L-2-hydroxyglutarate oxidase LhgO
LTPDYAGIRPKLHGPGEPQPDFQLHGVERHGMEGLMALFGIESPGLTSSLAIGEAVAAALTEAA